MCNIFEGGMDLLMGNDWMQKTLLQLRAGIGCHQIITTCGHEN